jgi:transcriptional regulator with XRE-family HTH domain
MREAKDLRATPVGRRFDIRNHSRSRNLNSHTRTSRSARINPKRLVELRKKRGWTQVQLAEAAGYSERVSLKAESGAPISLATIAALAQALAADREPMTVSDLLRTTVEIAREFLLIMYRHQCETIHHAQHLLAADAEFRIGGESAGRPIARDLTTAQATDRLTGPCSRRSIAANDLRGRLGSGRLGIA